VGVGVCANGPLSKASAPRLELSFSTSVGSSRWRMNRARPNIFHVITIGRTNVVTGSNPRLS
jgi:hypothetical protein